MTTRGALIQARRLVVGYGERKVLGPLGLCIPGGRFVCLIGPNGTGKSTLIRSLAGMQRALSGELMLDGDRLEKLQPTERARRLAVVLTERLASGALTGGELVALGRHPHTGWGGTLRPRDREAINRAMQDMGSTDLAQRPIAEMSDGERQRVLIARALAQEPRVLILDEATAFLDLPRRIEVMGLLKSLARHREIAVLLSSHDLELALRKADEVWLIDRQQQLHVGAPEDLVLSGLFTSAFSADGLVFDLERGELRQAHAAVKPIRLSGNGPVRMWVTRAIERAGYVTSDEAPDCIEIDSQGYRIHSANGSTTYHPTIRSLLDQLEMLQP